MYKLYTCAVFSAKSHMVTSSRLQTCLPASFHWTRSVFICIYFLIRNMQIYGILLTMNGIPSDEFQTVTINSATGSFFIINFDSLKSH